MKQLYRQKLGNKRVLPFDTDVEFLHESDYFDDATSAAAPADFLKYYT